MKSGDVYLHDALLYFEREWVHLADHRGHRIEPQDALILECIARGVNDFGSLCSELSEIASGQGGEDLALELESVLEDPRSVLQLRPPIPIETPDVIVCDFNVQPAIIDSSRLVRDLRRRSRRVLHLGLPARIRGPARRNLSCEASKKNGWHESWYRFAQWCRGIVSRHPEAVLVLCGPQDAVLFGDLAAKLPTLLCLDTAFPLRTPVSDLFPAESEGLAPIDAVRSLIYALRFGSEKELHNLHRHVCSDFALLESFALRSAALVAYSGVDQEGVLERAGVGPEARVFVLPDRPRYFARKPFSTRRRILALVAGMEEGADPIAPVLHVLFMMRDAHELFDEIAILAPDGWRRVGRSSNLAVVQGWSGPPPHPSNLVAALALPGLLRDPHPVADCVVSGVPTFLVPSASPHPLHTVFRSPWILETTTPSSLSAVLRSLGEGGGERTRAMLQEQRERFAALQASRMVEAWIAGRVRDPSGTEEASRT